MIIVKNRLAGFLLASQYRAMCIWPFLFIRPGVVDSNLSVTLNHERIHARQQLEMLWLFFFIWYGIEYMVRLQQYRNHQKAYHNLSHEREAHSNERYFDYLKKRKVFAWLKYL